MDNPCSVSNAADATIQDALTNVCGLASYPALCLMIPSIPINRLNKVIQ